MSFIRLAGSVFLVLPVLHGATPSTLVVNSSASPSTLGQSIALTAAVSPSSATGKVTFYDDVAVLGSATLSGGQAIFSTSLLASGKRRLKAQYAGDSTYAPSQSPVFDQLVNARPQVGFQPAVPYAFTGGTKVGFGPGSAVAGDFNGDGRPDLAATALNEVDVFMGNGDGTFQAGVPYDVPIPQGVVTGDFNQDGRTDLAVVVETMNETEVILLIGNGDGTFQTPINAGGGFSAFTQTMIVGDFNGDTLADIAVADPGMVNAVGGGNFSALFGGGLFILFGKGDGTFAPPASFDIGGGATAMAVGDFNGDGKADIAVDRQGALPGVQVGSLGTGVLFGNGDGTFQPILVLTGDGATAGDFNGDGIDDLALINNQTDVVRVYPGSLSGTFQTPLDSAPSRGGFSVGDFNGDGVLDLVSGDNSELSIFLGKGDGTFYPAVGFAPGIAPAFIAVSSFSGSGSTDLVSMGYSAIASVVLGIAPAPGTSIVLTSSLNPSHLGQSFTLTATFSPSPAAGLVLFYDGSVEFGTASLSSGSATLAVPPSALALGTHSLTALFGEFGSLNNPVFTSPVLTQTVIAPSSPTTTTLTTSLNPSVFGQQITLTATVTGAGNGSVTFYDGVTVLGTGTLAGGKVTLATILPGAGARSLTARYDGAGSDAPSVSAAFVQMVNALPLTRFHAAVPYPGGNSDVAIIDINGDGKPDITMAGPKSDLIVMLGNADGSFQSPLHIAGSANVVAVTAGDLNGDGHIDLVALNDDTSSFGLQVSADVFLGRGDGTFETPVSYPLSLNNFEDFGHITIADLNVDGRADLVIAESSLLVLLGNGDGTFRPPITDTLSDPFVVVTADFNGDGKPDLATLSDGGLGVQMGNGDGTFQAPVFLNAGGSGLTTGDFNGDGKADLASPGYGDNVEILPGNGDGTFRPPILVPVGVEASSAGLGDFNGDGKPDLAIVGGSQLLILTGNGDGTFQVGGSYAAAFSSDFDTYVQVADFNGDGLPDVATGSTMGGSPLNILLGASSGKASTSTTLTSSQNPSAAGDIVTLIANVSPATFGAITFFDGAAPIGTVALSGSTASLSTAFAVGTHSLTASYGGALAFASSTSPVLTQVVVNGSSATPTTAILSSSLNPALVGESVTLTTTVAPAAATGKVTFYDGSTALGTSVLSGGTATFTTNLLETGSHSLKAIYEGDVVNYARSETSLLKETVSSLAPTGFQSPNPLLNGGLVTSADFNGDGKPDLAYLTINNGNTILEIFAGNGDGTFASPQSYSVCAGNFAVADLDGDGNADIATNCGEVLLGRGDGTFSMGPSFPVSENGVFIAVADFNQDGKVDVAISDYIASKVYVSLGNGDGTFQGALGFDVGVAPRMMVAGDFNGDGLPDLAVATNTNLLSVLLNNGNGFAQPINYSTAFEPAAVAAADMNADGKLDLVFTAYDTTDQTESLTTLLGNGDGTFHHPSLYGYPSLSGFAIGDLNGDGKPDIAVGNYYQQGIFYGNGDGTLQTPVKLSGFANSNLIIVDLNRDGRNDIVGSEVTLAEPVASSFPGVIISSSQNPAASIDSITLTAQVSPTDATGSVTFYDGSITLGVSALSQGTASLTVKSLSAGSHSLTAVYGGGGGLSSATSAVLTETILAELTPGPVSADPLAANVLVNPSAEEGLTGWSPSSAESTVVSQGAPGFGSHSFEGKQVRDAFITQTVHLSQLALNPGSQIQGGKFVANYSFWFADSSPGSGSYGSITLTFLDANGNFLGQGVSNNLQNTGTTVWLNGTGSFLIPPTTDVINYTMDFLTTSSANTGLIDGNSLTIVGPTGTTLGSSENPASAGDAVTLNASVLPQQVSGTVSFFDGSGLLGTANTRDDGTASLTVSNLALGKHSLTAVFGGSGVNDPSTSNVLTEVILTRMTPGAPVPNPLTANLLVNPGAEQGTTGWYASPFYAGYTPVVLFSPAHSTGSYSFWSGNLASEFITQTINLTENSGFTFAQVDSGKLAANYSFWFFDFFPGSGEHGEITLTFLDANGVPLAQGISAALSDPLSSEWVDGTGSFPLPIGTRIIHYTMDFLSKQPPGPTQVFMDDNVLTISATP